MKWYIFWPSCVSPTHTLPPILGPRLDSRNSASFGPQFLICKMGIIIASHQTQVLALLISLGVPSQVVIIFPSFLRTYLTHTLCLSVIQWSLPHLISRASSQVKKNHRCFCRNRSFLLPLQSCYSKCGPWTSNLGKPWELIRKAELHASFQTYCIKT